jgi:thiamine pyrophosphokinase
MMTNNKCIIFANGRPPAKSVLSILKKKGYITIICADGGANSAKKINVLPDYIIGDLDSISKDTLKYYNKKSEIIKIIRQNDTDVEKCIKFAIKKKLKDIVLVGVTGNRLDHSFCNLGIVLKFFRLARLRIIAEDSLLAPYSGIINLATCSGETISLYGISAKTKISSEGLYYPLKNISLPFGVKESTSNIAIGNSIKLRVSGGVIFIIRDFKTVIKNDLF